jgi:hypothetical protein
MYCQSTSYGKGCRYNPSGVHFHADDVTRCGYCSSLSYGPGCNLNPTGNIHIHGINYNSMINDSIKSCIQNSFLISELYKKITDFQAYKLGIIDEQGNKIKEPVLESEKASYTPFTKTLLKIKKFLGPKLELIQQTALMESSSREFYNQKNHLDVLKYEDKIKEINEQYYKTVNEALNDGLSLEQIEAIILG